MTIHQKIKFLFFLTTMTVITSCVDTKSGQNSEKTYNTDEQYDHSPEDENYFEKKADVDFTNSAEVLNYLSDKNFRSPDGSKMVRIGYDGVSINGTPAYFNLDITIIGGTTAYIKGQSLTNPNGVINIRVDGDIDCIFNDGTSFCLRL